MPENLKPCVDELQSKASASQCLTCETCVLESVAFIQNPANRDVALKSLVKNLRLSNTKEAENGYEVLQWLYSLDIKPQLKGIQNMQRLLAVTSPKVATVKAEDVVDENPAQRVEKTSFYQDLLAHGKR